MKHLRPWRRCFWQRWVGPHDLPSVVFVGQVNRCGRCHALFVVRHDGGGVHEWVEDYSTSQRTAYYEQSCYFPPRDYWERTTKSEIRRENEEGSWATDLPWCTRDGECVLVPNHPGDCDWGE